MSNIISPTPKTQKEIEETALGTSPEPENSDRSNQISMKGDTTKPFSIGLDDIDGAIDYYFKNVIKPTVIQNGTKIEVPLIYGSPERWVSAQKQGYLKDKNNIIMSPIIMFKRDTIDKVRNIGNKLDANNPHNYAVVQKSYSQKNEYDNFAILTNRIPEKINYAVVIPDYVLITYNCVIFTYLVEQMNKIVEAINYASDSYWGDPARFKFNARIDSFNTITELNTGEERLVKSTFNIKLNGYLLPDNIQKEMNSIKKFQNKTNIIITENIFQN